MVPNHWTTLAFKAEACKTEVTGIFAGEQALDWFCLVIGTDASSDPHTKDSRLRAVGWAAVVCELRQGELLELGTISGMLPPPATVPQDRRWLGGSNQKHSAAQRQPVTSHSMHRHLP